MNADAQLRLYQGMLRIRLVELHIANLYPQQQMRCPVHLCIGQEAVSAAVCQCLTTQDTVLSGHRSHGHYIAKGGSLQRMFSEIYGKQGGCSRGRGGSMHLIDLECGFLGATPIVASTIPIGVGAAYSYKLQGKNQVCAVFFGDGATEEGVFAESLNFAALSQSPVVFVCENNFYSVYSPLNVRQPAGRDLAGIARSHGIEVSSADGNDAVAIYRVSLQAVERARQHQPQLLMFDTYRWLEHCGPGDDDALGYRPVNELATWKEKCPVAYLKDKLVSEGLATVEQLAKIEADILQEIDAAEQAAQNDSFPTPDELERFTYAS